MVNIAIVGLGYWGPNLLRNFNANSNCYLKYAVDKKEELLNKFSPLYPNTEFIDNFETVLNDPEVDAIIIATPVWSHFDLAKKALLNNKHVLVEKPMTSTSAEAEELIKISDEKGLTLMVDHTFLYTGAVQKMKSLVESGELGDVNYFDSTRINLGLFQADINVLWDLAPHDISILSYVLQQKPVSVQATGISHTKNDLENIAYLTLKFDSDTIAHFNCSWSSPVKIRSILVGGSNKMLVYNDMEPSEKVKIYDHGYNVKTLEKNKILADYRIGDISIPKLVTMEALAGVAEDFISSITNGTEPLSNKHLGHEVVKVLEASNQSLKENGALIKI